MWLGNKNNNVRKPKLVSIESQGAFPPQSVAETQTLQWSLPIRNLKMVKSCWKPSIECDSRGCLDGLLWYKDLGQHVYGDFSMAVIQVNSLLEDRSQLQLRLLSSSRFGQYVTVIGVKAYYVSLDVQHVSENQDISINDLIKAFLVTEDEFLSLVRKQWLVKPQMASVGSCCLTGVICNGLLYIAPAGDSRVVLGRSVSGTNWQCSYQPNKMRVPVPYETSYGSCIPMIHILL
ncbi:probable protein phosphatase 2C 38 [Hibiscus syriacus]|uniref:probable protein phosphatase 2C 38 n=1 Tax=Hibiscus syriacus TaxID=106335 RepID=UPI00192478EF|nr:probable protein phosphatase 2C 38 [Hibiscus syriacus]